MADLRNWMARLFLHTPASVRSIRNVPVVGDFAHRISRRLLPSDEMLWAQVEAGPAKGLWLELNPRTGTNYLRGDVEEGVQKILSQRLSPGAIFYDLGANIGLFSLLAVRAMSGKGKVFSFEPDVAARRRLRANIERNGFSNVEIVEAGIWSSSCEMTFLAADASSPDRGTGRIEARAERGGATVRCVSLDDFAQTAPPPDAIKCDVEGAEVEMLRGAKGILTSRRPWILFEMHSESNDRACRAILREFGYGFESVDSNHVLAVPQRSPG